MPTGAHIGTVTRVTGTGAVYVELPDVAPGFEFGPCLDTVGDLVKGNRVITQGLARDEDELVITGLIGGLDGAYAPLVHQHHADDIDDGVLALARLPVAPSGNSNPTQVPRADDARLSDARTPVAHSHAMADLPAAAAALAAYPVGAYFISHVSTSPATLFGGTWTAVTDRVLIGVGANVRWDTPGETGGTETVTLTAAQSGLPAHTHVQDAHSHATKINTALVNTRTAGGATFNVDAGGADPTALTTATNQNNAAQAASAAHDNMPPFTAAYMWRRTA